MSEYEDFDDEGDVPICITEAATAAVANLLPEKSKHRYEKEYDTFKKWCITKKVKKTSEDVLLAYMAEANKKYKSSTLWSVYSMLRSMLLVKENVNISKFSKLKAYLKRASVGYQAKKSRVFSRNEVDDFLLKASDDTYLMMKVKKGVVNLGYDYEKLLPAFFALKLLTDLTIESFSFNLNASSFRKFDDLIVTIKNDNGTEKFAFQLKHRQPGRDILNALDEFLGRKNAKEYKNFNISQYAKAYYNEPKEIQESYMFILFTNVKFENVNAERNFVVEEARKPFQTDAFNAGKIYTFRSRSATDEDDFYRHFFLLSEQKNVPDLEKAIENILRNKFDADESVITCYIDFFGKLRAGSYTNTEITKDEVILKLTDLLLARHTIEVPLVAKQNDKINSLEDAIKHFDITLIDSNKHLIETKWQQRYLEKITDEDIKQLENFKLLKKDEDHDLKVKTLVLCYLKEKPFFVNVTDQNEETVYRVVHLCRRLESLKLNFVLVGNQLKRQAFEGWKIFQNLADLNKTSDLHDEITNTVKVSVQGREATSLLTLHSDFGVHLDEFITISDMLASDDVVLVGTEIEPLPEPFIRRRLLKTAISSKLLKKISAEERIVIYCGGSSDYVKDYLLAQDKDLDVSNQTYYDSKKTGIIVTDQQVDPSFFQTSDHLLQLSKKSKINTLEYIDPRPIKDERKLIDSQLNVICGESGIGKTTMIKYLAVKCPLGYWIVNIPLKQSKSFLKEDHDIDEILQHFLYTDQVRNARIIDHFKRKKRLIFMFDGLDELSREIIDGTIKIIKELAHSGYKMWIICTKNLLNTLRSTLDMDFIMYLDPLNREEQKSYISKKLTKFNETREHIDKVINNIFNNDLKSINVDMLKLPLFLNILTEILNADKNFGNIQDILSSMKIYSYFIAQKFHYYLKKMNSDHLTDSIIGHAFKSYYFQEYQIAALKACLEPLHFKALSLASDPKFIEQVRSNDVLGLVVKVNEDGTFIFSHHTLAEYFAAIWFSENILLHCLDHRKIIFHPKYVNIRHFFDMKLAEDCPLHMAILKQDLTEMKRLSQEHLHDLDKGGRTALHLAASFGKHYPQSSTQHEEILKHLLSLDVDQDKRDDLLHWNCFQYAYACCSLNSLEKLGEKQSLQIDDYRNLEQFEDEEARSYLHVAIENGYNNVAKFLIDHNIDLERTDCRQFTPLHEAAFWGRSDVAKLLLDKDVSTEFKDFRGKTPIQFAAKMGDEELVKLLVENGAEVNTTDGFKKTPLEKASSSGHINVVKLLLENDADVDSQNTDKCTALHRAAQMGRLSTVESLLKHGANIEAVDMYERTALHFATLEGHRNVVEYLLSMKGNIFARDEEGKTPLDIAKEKNNAELVRILDNAQRDNSGRATYTGSSSSLHQAARDNDLEKIKKLLSEDGSNIDELDHSHQTILHIACYEGHEDLVHFLLEKGADLNAKGHDGRYPLHFASQRGHISIIQKLLQYEGQLHIVDNFRRTPLHRAAYKGHLKAVNVLVDAGYDPNTTYYKEETSLHSAARSGNNDIIDYLVSRGGRIDAKNKNVETCLHLAAQLGCTETVDHLVEKYPEILDEVDIRGMTALHWAAEKGYKTMLKVLVEEGANIHIRDRRKETALDTARRLNRQEIVEYLSKNNNFCNT